MYVLMIGLWFAAMGETARPQIEIHGPRFETKAECEATREQYALNPGQFRGSVAAKTVCHKSEDKPA